MSIWAKRTEGSDEVQLRKVVNIWIASYLHAKGFSFVKYEQQEKSAHHLVYFFEDTPGVAAAVDEYVKGGLIGAIDLVNSYKLLKGLKYDLNRQDN